MLLHNGAIKWEKKKKNIKWAETLPRVVFYQSPTSPDRPSPIQRLRSICRCINRPANARARLSPIPFPSLPRIPPQIPPPLRIRRRRRLPPPLLPLLQIQAPRPPSPSTPTPLPIRSSPPLLVDQGCGCGRILVGPSLRARVGAGGRGCLPALVGDAAGGRPARGGGETGSVRQAQRWQPRLG